MTENFCKRCLLYESGKEEILSDIENRISKIDKNEKCIGEEYAQRLGICTDCDFLADGTCLKCGCYPEFRAAFIKNRCPIKKW